MKIMICASMYFAKEMIEHQKALEKMGHSVHIPDDAEECVKNPELNMDLEHCMQTDIVKKCFNKIADSDAILILNYPKNGIRGYVGGAVLMEIGLAQHLNKKIFMMDDIPSEKELRYALEIKLAKPVIINGNLKNIK